MTPGFFVTGTDTGVGKTRVSAALLHYLGMNGLRVCGMKPVASGCREVNGQLRNDDADDLIDASNIEMAYDLICPYRFAEPVAPHIAAQAAGMEIRIEKIMQCYASLQSVSDVVVVEGVGGWQVPLNETQALPELAKALALPVVIVVGGRLGCINHALMTADSVLASGLPLAGWVFNQIDPDMLQIEAVKETLKSRMPAKMLADIPWQEEQDTLIVKFSYL